jgi:hypothetical protein
MAERNGNGASGAPIVAGLLLALGIAYAGHQIAGALRAARATERFVSVKGLSEREVNADLAVWPLTFSAVNDQLAALHAELERGKGEVFGFLSKAGFAAGEMTASSPSIADLHTERHYGGAPPPARYHGTLTVTLRSNQVAKVKTLTSQAGALIERGVVLASGGQPAQYFFTGLNAIKPAMIAEATKNARKAAQQFAADSGSQVGAIREARQGLFTIEDRDAFTPEIKAVRVVTTVDYFLADEAR